MITSAKRAAGLCALLATTSLSKMRAVGLCGLLAASFLTPSASAQSLGSGAGVAVVPIGGGFRVILLPPSSAASSPETIAYSYDVLGRLTQVARTGGINNGVNSAYHYDQADNRVVRWIGSGAPPAAPPLRPPFFAISDAIVREGDTLGFIVTKSGSASSAYSVNFSTVADTAVGGPDFQAASGTLTFGSGEYAKTVSISTISDTSHEPDETMFVDLSGASGGAVISRARAIGRLLDDDVPPTPAPTAITDNASTNVCAGTIAINVIANDTDPNGHLPLKLEGIQSATSGHVGMDGVNILFSPGSSTGTAVIRYTVSNSLGGLATGTLNVQVTSTGPCQ